MRQSTLAFICGLALFLILAFSWCGKNPETRTAAISPTPTVTPTPVAQAATTATASASVAVAQASPTPPPQSPPPEFVKVAQKAGPAIIELTVFDAKGQLLRSGNGFFVSRDGTFATSASMIADGAYGVAKTNDGKIRNVMGVLASSQESDVALLRAETKTGVPFLPLAKTSESIAVNAWAAVVGSSLQHKEQPIAAGMISSLGPDPKKDAFEIGGTVPADATGAPVLDADGDVVGIVTAGGKNSVRPTGLLEPLLTAAKTGTPRWAAAPVESPTASPSVTPRLAAHPRVLFNPAPKYPYEARMIRSGPTRGSGRFRVTFDTNGGVRSVQTLESTGQPILDQAAINALRQWKADPAAQPWTVQVPITFQP